MKNTYNEADKTNLEVDVQRSFNLFSITRFNYRFIVKCEFIVYVFMRLVLPTERLT